MKRLIAAAAGTVAGSGLLSLLRPAMRGRATILMLHRFREAEHEHAGADPRDIARHLEWLRKHGYPLMSLADASRALLAGEPLADGAVIVTVDDGYADFARAGLDIFARYDCPVTVFLVSGFLDGRLWLWWDQVEYACLTSAERTADLNVGGQSRRVLLGETSQRRQVARDLAEALKLLPDAQRRQSVVGIAATLGVQLPDAPPAAWAPMTWDEVRAATRRGASFGAHTDTHPVLSRTDDAVSAHEITASWSRIRAEVPDAVPVFCYPNGTPADFGAREIRTLEAHGFETAVSTIPGYAGAPLGDWRWRLPRFSWPASDAAFYQIVAGVERLKMKLRGESPA